VKLIMKGDQVLLKLDDTEADHRGMVLTAEGVVHRAPKPSSGIVLAVGPGKRHQNTGKRIPVDCDVGDHVRYETDRGTEYEIPGYGPHLRIREKFILFAF